MKKAFGILLILIGLFIIMISMYSMGNTDGEVRCVTRNLEKEYIQQYKLTKESDLSIAICMLFVGFIINTLGIVLITRKSSKQRMLEAELNVLKNNSTISVDTNKDVIAKIEQLGILRSKGLISGIEFEEQKKKILN